VTATFAFGTNGALYDRSVSYASGTGIWSEPQGLTSTGVAPAGAGVAAVATVLGSTPVADVFFVGNDQKVQYVTESNDGAWSAAADLPGQPTGFAPAGAPVVAIWYGGQLGVFLIDNTGALQIQWWNPVLGWLGPVALTAGGYAPLKAALATGVRGNGELDVYVIGSDGGLKYMAFNGTAWAGPISLTLGGFAPPGGGVSAAPDVNGFLNVFTFDNNGALESKWDCSPLWCGPVVLTATSAAPAGARVSALQYAGLGLGAYYVDGSGNVALLSNPGTGWRGPQTIAAGVGQAGAWTALATEPSQLDLFFSQKTLGLSEAKWNGSSWSGAVLLP
jgi:hypothetical protein